MSNRIGSTIRRLRSIDELVREERWINTVHPLAKLVITIFYIIITVSFSKYDIIGLSSMLLYPIAVSVIGEIPLRESLWRLRVVLPLVCVVGAFNPIFDHKIIATLGGLNISGGVLSMLTLMIKAVCSVFASYLLIATTSIERICAAMRRLHIPRIIVTEILLIYRYVVVLLSEAGRITSAYRLRAPGQKGITHTAWGSLSGGLLLRSMDRAERVYDSMRMRGYQGEYPFAAMPSMRTADIVYMLVWLFLIALLRVVPVFYIVGRILI